LNREPVGFLLEDDPVNQRRFRTLWTVVMLALAIWIAGGARADVVVYTSEGFEPPAFVVGGLVGQRQWAADPPSAAGNATVQSASVRDGVRAARFDASGLSLTSFWFPTVNHTVSGNDTLIRVEADIRITSGGTPSAAWGIDVFDTSLRRIAYAFYSGSTGTIWVFDPVQLASFNTGQSVQRDTWRRWTFEIDYATRQSTFLLDGVAVGAPTGFSTLSPPGNTIGDADIRVTGPGTDALELDNYLITAVTVDTVCPGDTNGDRVVNGADLSVLLFRFGGPANGPQGADFNGDGLCNGADLSVLLFLFGTTCD